MNLKKLAVAMALAGVAAASTAAVAPANSGDGELFLVIQDSVAQISYLRDLGITMSAYSALSGVDQTINLNSDSLFTSFLSQTSANAAGYQWAVLAADSLGPVTGGNQRLFSTAVAGTTDALIQSTLNANMRSGIGSPMVTFFGAINNSGTHGEAGVALDFAINGSSVNNITDSGAGYFGEPGGTGPQLQANVLPYSMTNNIGVTSNFFSLASQAAAGTIGTAGFDQFDVNGVASTFRVAATGTNYSFNYFVSAVPEADGLALMLAGLGVFGFIGRRLRRD